MSAVNVHGRDILSEYMNVWPRSEADISPTYPPARKEFIYFITFP